MSLDDKDKALISTMQRDFPVVERPFVAIGKRLGMSENEVLSRVKRLVDLGAIRKIRGLVDKDALGIKAVTLMGMKVPPDRIDEVLEKVSSFEGVTHNYVRTHPEYNLWYAIEAKDEESLEKINDMIRKATGISDTINLPTIKRFKIDLKFDLG